MLQPTGLVATLRHRADQVAFMSPRDISLFLRSARTDAAIERDRAEHNDQTAFDTAYDKHGGDPWASGDRRYRYQSRKYDILANLLPAGRRFVQGLDLGSGLGLLGRRLARHADAVLGMDISSRAVEHARALNVDVPGLRFDRGDIRDIPASMDGCFDLVSIADTIYYLPRPLTDATLKALATRISRLLVPGGVCLLANHYFFAADPDSRVTRRIHSAFTWSPGFAVLSEHRRPFYLVSVLEAV